MILVDADVLAALVDRNHREHETCVRELRGLREPLGTVWPVVAAAAVAVGEARGRRAILEMVSRGALELLPLGPEDLASLVALLGRSSGRRPDLAHAALLRVAARERLRSVFTLSPRTLRAVGGRRLRFLPSRVGHGGGHGASSRTQREPPPAAASAEPGRRRTGVGRHPLRSR